MTAPEANLNTTDCRINEEHIACAGQSKMCRFCQTASDPIGRIIEYVVREEGYWNKLYSPAVIDTLSTYRSMKGKLKLFGISTDLDNITKYIGIHSRVHAEVLVNMYNQAIRNFLSSHPQLNAQNIVYQNGGEQSFLFGLLPDDKSAQNLFDLLKPSVMQEMIKMSGVLTNLGFRIEPTSPSYGGIVYGNELDDLIDQFLSKVFDFNQTNDNSELPFYFEITKKMREKSTKVLNEKKYGVDMATYSDALKVALSLICRKKLQEYFETNQDPFILAQLAEQLNGGFTQENPLLKAIETVIFKKE